MECQACFLGLSEWKVKEGDFMFYTTIQKEKNGIIDNKSLMCQERN